MMKIKGHGHRPGLFLFMPGSRMSVEGQSRPNWAVRAMSGLPRIATE